jgi:hypothetical protein
VVTRHDETGFKHTYGPEFWRVAGKQCHVHPDRGSSWPHHVKTVATGGRDHGNLYNGCLECHHAIENQGRKTYEKKHGVDIAKVAQEIGNEQGAFVPGVSI